MKKLIFLTLTRGKTTEQVSKEVMVAIDKYNKAKALSSLDKKNRESFGWFDWLIFIAAAFLMIVYGLSAVGSFLGMLISNSSFSGFAISFFLAVMFVVAFRQKYLKYKATKKN